MNLVPMSEAEYRSYLDPDMLRFIDETNAFYPPGSHELTIAEHRETYDAMSRAFHNGLPEGISRKDVVADQVPMRRYDRITSDDAAVVLYFHGGGFMLGGLDSHDDVVAEITATTGFTAFAVDYRLAPEHGLADAVEDAETALEWLRSNGISRIILAGDSAGGFLCAAIAERNRFATDMAGQVLIYPGLGGNDDSGSMIRHAVAPLLTADEIRHYDQIRRSGVTSPLDADSFEGLPPTQVMPAECDPIADQSRRYAEAIAAAGGTVRLIDGAGLVHGHLRARHRAARAAANFQQLLAAISDMGHGRFV